MWSNFFRDGGFGMFPTAGFGFLLLATSVALLLRPERRFVPLFAALALVTMSSALLGTTMGLINTFRFAADQPASEQLTNAFIGCAESMNVVILGCILTTLAGLLASIAALRASRRPVTEIAG
jgi:uncharacterized membrane protein